MKQLYMLQNHTLCTLKSKASKFESAYKIKGLFMIDTGTSQINKESYPFLMQHHQLANNFRYNQITDEKRRNNKQ
jgi:hypothetical protein